MKKMSKKLIMGTAMVASALSLAACGCRPEPSVYGPPADVPETTTQAEPWTEETGFEETDTYAPEPAVYGPPEYWN